MHRTSECLWWVSLSLKITKVSSIDLLRLKTLGLKLSPYPFQIGANAGIVGMTKEHLGLALALSVPVFVVVTKIDMCPENVLQDTLKLLFRILKSNCCRKVPVLVKTHDEVVLSATNFVSQRLCPIFQVSNVNGLNLDLLKNFLNLLTIRSQGLESLPAEFLIDDTYTVPGVGTVVSGTCLQGVIRLNDTLLLGPDPTGRFQPIAVRSIHRKRMNVAEVRGGQTASFALKKIKRAQIRKGMVMVAAEIDPKACWEFEGEILVLHHPTTISSRYQAMVHCGSIRQTASIVAMDKDCLRTGDKARVRFHFIKHPEYIRPGQRMVFREGRTKAVGNVIRPLPAPARSHVRPSKQSKNSQRQGSCSAANQNRNPNVQAAAAAAKVVVAEQSAEGGAGGGGGGKGEEANEEIVFEMGTDKRDTKLQMRRTTKRSTPGPQATQ